MIPDTFSNMLPDISTVTWIASVFMYVVFALTLLIGALTGKGRGLYRSGVKLLANVASVAIAVFLTRYLSDSIIRTVFTSDLSVRIFGVENPRVLVGIAVALVSVIAFALVFFIVRLFMLIPQAIICSKLPVKYADAFPPKGTTTEPAHRDPQSKLYPFMKAFWSVGAALMGAIGAMVVLGVYIFPLVCFTVHSSEPIKKSYEYIPDTVEVGLLTIEVKEFKDSYAEITGHPLMKTVDFMFRKTVYRPLLKVELYEGNGNLDDFSVSAMNFVADVLPAASDIMNKKGLTSEGIASVKNGIDGLTQDKVTMSLAAMGMNISARPFCDYVEAQSAKKGQLTQYEKKFLEALSDVLLEATAETVSSDMNALAEMLDSLKGSNIISLVVNDDETTLTELSSDSLFGEESLGKIFGAAYDSAGTRKLIIPFVNVCFEGILEKSDIEPVYSEKTLDQFTRSEFVEEGKRLAAAFDAIASFLESISAEDAKVSDYDFAAMGKALDCLKSSILFGDNYNVLLDSISTMMKNESNDSQVGDMLGIIQNAIASGDSAEKVLSSTQDMIVVADELRNGEKKGSENEKIVSALDNLKNLESESDRQAVNNITEEILGTVLTEENDNKNAIMADSVKAITEVLEEGTYDSAKEADAIQVLYDMSEDKSSVSGKEKEITDTVLDSKIADKLINNLNEKDENYGIADELSEANKQSFLEAINASNADNAKKEALKQFLGIN